MVDFSTWQKINHLLSYVQKVTFITLTPLIYKHQIKFTQLLEQLECSRMESLILNGFIHSTEHSKHTFIQNQTHTQDQHLFKVQVNIG